MYSQQGELSKRPEAIKSGYDKLADDLTSKYSVASTTKSGNTSPASKYTIGNKPLATFGRTSPQMNMSSDVESELVVKEKTDVVPEEPKPTLYAWFVLFLIFGVRAIHQLHRMIIGFSFGYQALGDKAGNPKYMLSEAYPQL